jgi:V/A-type H+-transporting ATPase subunit E
MTEKKKPPQQSSSHAPVEELLASEVIADAERRAERIRQRAERDAHEVRQSAEKEAQQAADTVLREGRRRADQASHVVLAMLGVQEQKLTLALKEEVVTGALDASWQKLLAKDEYDYGGTLIQLAAAAIAQMPGEEFTLQLGEADGRRVGKDLCRSIEEAVAPQGRRAVRVYLSPAYLPIAGGCVVTGEKGRLRYDNSFEARRRRLHEEARRRAARGLFGDAQKNSTGPPADE